MFRMFINTNKAKMYYSKLENKVLIQLLDCKCITSPCLSDNNNKHKKKIANMLLMRNLTLIYEHFTNKNFTNHKLKINIIHRIVQKEPQYYFKLHI